LPSTPLFRSTEPPVPTRCPEIPRCPALPDRYSLPQQIVGGMRVSTTAGAIVREEQSLDAVVRPQSIAIIGCSRRRGTIGYQIVDNLLVHGYTGALHRP